MNARHVVAVAALGAASLASAAGEETIKLKEGPGVDKVRQNCVSCHSLDYIPMNSPILDQKGWEAVVAKMQKAFAAPIAQEDAAPIAEYLARYYGKR